MHGFIRLAIASSRFVACNDPTPVENGDYRANLCGKALRELNETDDKSKVKNINSYEAIFCKFVDYEHISTKYKYPAELL